MDIYIYIHTCILPLPTLSQHVYLLGNSDPAEHFFTLPAQKFAIPSIAIMYASGNLSLNTHEIQR